MLIFYGTVMCGQADVVKNHFSVGTEFFQILYFPIFPLGSYVVFDQAAPKRVRQSMELEEEVKDAADAGDEPSESDQEDERRFRIPMSGKSVLLGYIRGWGFWLAVFCGFLGGMLWLMSRSGDDPEAAEMFPGFLWVAGVGLVIAMASYYGPWNTASPRRAKQLCEATGMDTGTLPKELREAMLEP